LQIENWISEYKFQLKIKNSRLTKLGDYRHPYKGKPHEITINKNLNKYSFLIILIHEIAHLTTWNKYHKNTAKVLPHGIEWKLEFKILLQPFFEMEIFPEDVYDCLKNYSLNPKASSCADTSLMKVLKKYDINSEYIHLEDVPERSIFRLRNGRTFIKYEKIRKRFKCQDTESKKYYLVSPVAEVTQITLF